jgi:hypothetical protein
MIPAFLALSHAAGVLQPQGCAAACPVCGTRTRDLITTSRKHGDKTVVTYQHGESVCTEEQP